MKYEKLEVVARGLSEEERGAGLRGLVEDPRFAAVVRTVLDQAELARGAACGVSYADRPGCLAHAAGVEYATRELLGRFREVCERGKKGAG